MGISVVLPSQLRELGALCERGQLRLFIDLTFEFDQTLEAIEYVERGRTEAAKLVVSMEPDG